MKVLKGFYKFIWIYPWLFLGYFFLIGKTGGYLLGLRKDDVLSPFLIGLFFGAIIILPIWILSSAWLLSKEPSEKKNWMNLALFLLPALCLYLLLKNDAYGFWGGIVD
jgi:hypothetical protein